MILRTITLGAALLGLTTACPLYTATPAVSAQLVLSWDFPKSYGTSTWTLTVARTYQGETSKSQVVLTAMDAATCQRLAGETYQADQTWCASLPCPTPGAYNMQLQADNSEPSNVLSVVITDHACHITTFEGGL